MYWENILTKSQSKDPNYQPSKSEEKTLELIKAQAAVKTEPQPPSTVMSQT